MEKAKADYLVQLTGKDTRNKQLVDENADMKHVIDSYNHPNPQVSGGHIVLVNEAENSVYLDLGSDDGLNRKTTFNVYPRGTVNVTNVPPKGQIEVTNVSAPHTSEARVVNNPINDPLLPGDVVHSVEWAPGQHPHYAITGVVDLNGNGKDQTQKLIEMIRSTGGQVDAYIENYTDTDGKPAARTKGKIDYNTRYLIVAPQMENTPDGAARLTANATLMKEAKDNNVEEIGLDKFLDMMGYVATARRGFWHGRRPAESDCQRRAKRLVSEFVSPPAWRNRRRRLRHRPITLQSLSPAPISPRRVAGG